MCINRFRVSYGRAAVACVVLSCLSALAAVDPSAREQVSRPSRMDANQALQMGLNYLTGRKGTRDLTRAAQLLQEAAEAGQPEAQTQLGMMYQTGTGVPQDFALALHWYQLAAASGGLSAKVNMGLLYAKGRGVAQDPAMAQQLFRQAFEKGYGSAAGYLGEMYFSGIGVQKDGKAAEQWFAKGVKKHDAVSMYDLGTLYTGEYGHRPELGKAAELLRRSAKLKYLPAEYSLGLLLTRHPELSDSIDEARTWLESASEGGFWKANAVLGILSRDGTGVAKDQEQALYYFKLAMAQGGEGAQKLLKTDLSILEASIGADKAAKIDARADAWVKDHPPLFLTENSGTGEMTLGESAGAARSTARQAQQNTGDHPPA